MLTVKDIMTRDVITIPENAKLHEAIDLMLKHKISGLPVTGSGGNLTGIITEKDLIQVYNKTSDIPYMTVRELMTKPVITFYEDETFEEICRCLEKTDFRRVPVINTSGKVIGIISRPDITQRILENLRQKTILKNSLIPEKA
jgi:CBS domain-containing protein